MLRESTFTQYKETLDLKLQWTVVATINEGSEDLSMFKSWSPELHQVSECVCDNVRDAPDLANGDV